jgi:uncharacterized protein involved in outer membrane biogenesis
MKTIIKLISSLVVLGIVVIVALYFSLNKIVEKGITTFGSQTTLTEVTLEESNISLFSGKGELKGLVIGNPKGFSSNNAFSLDRIKVAVDVKSIFTDNIVIKEILIDVPKISYELDGKKSNINAILDNMNSSTEKEEKAQKTEGKENGSQKKVIIDLLKITDGKVTLAMTMLGGKGSSLGFSDMTMRGLGREKGGLTPEEAALVIFSSLNKGVSGAVSVSAGDLKGKTKNLLEGVKGLFGK